MWLSPDPILGQYMTGKPNSGVFRPLNLALYTYAYNSPAVLRDPTGLCPNCIGDALAWQSHDSELARKQFEAFNMGTAASVGFIAGAAGAAGAAAVAARGTPFMARLLGFFGVRTGAAASGAAAAGADPRVQQAGQAVVNQGQALVAEAQAALPAVTKALSSGDLGKVIGWGRGQSPEAIAKTFEVTKNVTTSAIEKMMEQGLTKEWVTRQLGMYSEAIKGGTDKLRNAQLLPRAELMKKILDLWPKDKGQ
jgi:hypothetical protein